MVLQVMAWAVQAWHSEFNPQNSLYVGRKETMTEMSSDLYVCAVAGVCPTPARHIHACACVHTQLKFKRREQWKCFMIKFFCYRESFL